MQGLVYLVEGKCVSDLAMSDRFYMLLQGEYLVPLPFLWLNLDSCKAV